ncbi:MAG: tetratricopeptide repeat protein, partial [Candidatus Latescibacteria bacterium]|nr:tetratricopeptide repeat protein [Candidatus Latescibacterota bacterium]NIO77449.1 tetratricopeptide repeat protein [Candidatus Latescibacterota bacterium]
MKQRKFSQAIAMLEEILTKHSTSFLRDKALMKIAKLQTMMGDLEQAIVSYERLITEFGDESLLLDRARLGIAEIYDFHMKDRQKAIETYQKLLEQSPNSIYAGQARQRIRRL